MYSTTSILLHSRLDDRQKFVLQPYICIPLDFTLCNIPRWEWEMVKMMDIEICVLEIIRRWEMIYMDNHGHTLIDLISDRLYIYDASCLISRPNVYKIRAQPIIYWENLAGR